MDDGGIIGPPELLQLVWDILSIKGPPIGLHLNPSKCEWTWLDRDCSDPCPLRSASGSFSEISCVPLDEITMLGVPIGSLEFDEAFIRKKLFSRLIPALEKLTDFNDSQAAFFLLHTSFSIVGATHFMRTVPLSRWLNLASLFDDSIRSAAEAILGFPFPDPAYKQAWWYGSQTSQRPR